MAFASDSAYPPYTFVGPDGEPRGLDVDVARAVGRLLGVAVELRMLPWEQAVQSVRSGDADALAGMTRTADRLAEWAFAEPHATVQYRLFVREDTQTIHDLRDLQGMRVGVGKGSLVEPLLRANPKITVVNYPRREAMEELLNREIMAFAGNWLVQSHFIQSHGIRGIKVVGEPLLPTLDYAIAVPKTRAELLPILNSALLQLRSSGELAAIQRKWFGELLRPPLISPQALRRLWIGLGTAAALALLALIRSWELRRLLRRKTERIAALRKLGTGLGQTHQPAPLLARAMSVLGELMKHESLFVVVRANGNEQLHLQHLRLPPALAEDLHHCEAGDGIVPRVVRTGQPITINRLDAGTRLVRVAPAEHGLRSAVCLPIKIANRTVGALGILSRRGGRALRRESDFHQAVAAELGIALDNARLVATLEQRVRERTEQLNERNRILEADLRMAREVQIAMLPFQNTPVAEIARSDGSEPLVLRLYNRYHAARTVGGDFFDVLQLAPGTVGVFLCDVMGQGARAALLTAILRTLLGEVAHTAQQPAHLLALLNQRLMDVLKTQDTPIFASAFFGCFNLTGRTLAYANAGHPWPLLLDKTNRTLQPLNDGQRPGPALGLFRDATFPQLHHTLSPGQTCLLFTDGLYETSNTEGQTFGLERVQHFLHRHIAEPPPQLLDGLLEQLSQFCGRDEPDDDICLLAVETAPAP